MSATEQTQNPLAKLQAEVSAQASALLTLIPSHFWIERELTCDAIDAAAEAADLTSQQAHTAIRAFLTAMAEKAPTPTVDQDTSSPATF